MEPVFSEDKISLLKQLLSGSKSVVLTMHHRPDGDALGSALGLKHVLTRSGHTARVVAPSEFPAFLDWMPGSGEVIDFIRNADDARSAFAMADLIICLDFNDPSRVEAMQSTLIQSSAPLVMIDHHLDPRPGFGIIQFSYPAVGSTSELVAHLLPALGIEHCLDRDSAECLYAGIMTDTGGFRFNSVTPSTHRILALLIAAGARNDLIHDHIYDNNSEWRMRFLGYTLHEKMRVYREFSTVVFTASQADMDRFNHESGDLEGIVNYGLSIRGMKMAVLFSERDGLVKISFRSKGDFSVKDLAVRHFEGGGHRNAAGGRSRLSLNETVEKFLGLLPGFKNELLQDV